MTYQQGRERAPGSGIYAVALKALGRLGLTGSESAARERVWSDRHRMLDDPNFRYLFNDLGDQIQHAMQGAGMDRTTMMAAHARAMALIFSCAGEALPTDGVTDARLAELGFRVEPSDTQTEEFRLVTLPDGWKMALGADELESAVYTARVIDSNSNIRLDLAFTTEPDGRAHGTVSEIPLPDLAASENSGHQA